ncbi:MAG: amidohydrolase family protein [Alphaproteobacteria bacterium]|jgi:predicted TIM-barrel fold metal-dependent hydrolase|nr:amidohydrolase family protein [Alphaproteobacteria bacterium]MDP6566379.1 amidohydrolase family protein [Alphaproteobacteria bacterium]MDP6814764.1 amidohydrolase family protein [Alphaproteobacteria bacterium]
MNDKERWLAKTTEEALEPELPICDPHHHLWDHQGSDIRRYLLDELLADIGGGHNVVSTVFLECMAFYRPDGPEALRPVGETEFVNGIATMSASGSYGPARVAAAIVGFADLRLGAAVDEVLTAHEQASGGRFRGIRNVAAFLDHPEINNSATDPKDGLYLDATFREGFARLAPRGLSFDAWFYHPQIPELTDLARAFPDTTIVLDHVGGPLGIGPFAGRREEVYQTWRPDIDELAQCPNVHVKLGGLAMKMCGFGYHKLDQPPSSEALAEDWQPYLQHCIERFGPERCMFESNFPVDKSSCGYTVLWNAFKRLAAGFSDDEKAALFHDTAARVYRI